MSKEKARDSQSSRRRAQGRPGEGAPEVREAYAPPEADAPEGDEVAPESVDLSADEVLEGEVTAAGDTPEAEHAAELQEALAAAEARAEENWNQFLRARAELENAQRRAKKDVEQARRQGIEKMAADLLQVKDSLEMGVQAAREADADQQKLLEGSELTLKMLNQVMERFEIEEIDPQGERFDPEYHEAMAMQPTHEQEPNTVVHVVQKGYRLQDRLLRPAMVMVAKAADGPPPGSGGRIDEQV